MRGLTCADPLRPKATVGATKAQRAPKKAASSWSTVVMSLDGGPRKVSFQDVAALGRGEKREGTASKGTQTDYRESEMQTMPWKHEVKASGSGLEELEELDWLRPEKHFPVGMDEVELMEASRERLSWWRVMKGLKGAENERERQTLVSKMTEIEAELGEKRKEAECGERIEISKKEMKEAKEAFEKKLQSRLLRSYTCRRMEYDSKMSYWHHQMVREMRKINSRKVRSATKPDIIAVYRDKASEIYAPKMRHGHNPALAHEVIDIQCRFLKRFHGLHILEKHLRDISRSDFAVLRPPLPSSEPKNPLNLCLRRFRGKSEHRPGPLLQLTSPLMDVTRASGGEGPSEEEWRGLSLRVAADAGEQTPGVTGMSEEEERMEEACLLLKKVVRGRAVQSGKLLELWKRKDDAMVPSRYMLVDEKSPYPLKRRVRDRRGLRGSDPAITLLPPDPYLIMEKPDFNLSLSPTVYRTTAPKSAKNKEASSFVILGETLTTPVQSRPASPSGRVSPFRGHGFKSPATTRPNSATPSPSTSPRKTRTQSKGLKTSEGHKVSKNKGLPPKSPPKPKATTSAAAPAAATAEAKAKDGKADADTEGVESKETEAAAKDCAGVSLEGGESSEGKYSKPAAEQKVTEAATELKVKSRATAVTPREKKPPPSPTPKLKAKAGKNQSEGQQSLIKKTTKPPLPPKKVGMKTLLKAEEDAGNQEKKTKKESIKGKTAANCGKKSEGEPLGPPRTEEPKGEIGMKAEVGQVEVTKGEVTGEQTVGKESEKLSREMSEKQTKEVNENQAKYESEKKVEEESVKAEEKEEKSDRKGEKLVPCFQPDKCQIAPPTMASPSPTVTPTISTPSTTSDLASSSIKNSQSIAAAPTTVTPSTLSSVSSTVVLTGNLARKEIQSRTRPKEPDVGTESAKETDVSLNSGMVKAASKDSIKWTKKDSLSGEMTSTKVIKADPEIEVLSPNNLRESPPRPLPPNLAWDEQRVANGDVPNKVEGEGKVRRMISAVWRLLRYVLCCRWMSERCCRKSGDAGVARPSPLLRLNCWRRCWSGMKCCSCGCKGKKCEGRSCCRRKAGDEEAKAKAKAKPKTEGRKYCAKGGCSCRGCCDKVKNVCVCCREKVNRACRSLFCLNLLCCQKFLRKFKCCHKLKCCQKNGFCSCCNPNVKKEAKKLNKKGSRTSNNSRDKDNLDAVLVEHTSLMKAAIPVLPSCLAVFCLILNLFVPGFGTLLSGVLCLCFGKARFSTKDTPKNRVGSFVVNTIIGVAQLFTVVFCLVGWGWSIWWGVIMYKLSRRQKRLKLAEKNQKEAEGCNVNHNHVDVEQG